LETEDVAVMIDAQHYCVKSRGVEDTGSSTVTVRLGGGFKTDASARNEFLSIARMCGK
jgi:GTP cyclohydrolase I